MAATRRRRREAPIPYSRWLFLQDGIDLLYKCDELDGTVALATNKRLNLGRELVLDPGFDDASKWTLNALGTSWSIAAGVAHCTSVDAFCSLEANTVPIYEDRTYVLTFTISNAATFAQMDIYATNGSGINKIANLDNYTNGSHVVPIAAIPGTISPSPGTELYLLARSAGSAFDIDDISFKQTGILASSAYSTPGDNPLDLTNTGLAPGQPGAGNVSPVYVSDGTTGRLFSASIAEYNSMINFTAGGLIASVSASTWAAGEDELHHSGVDINNYIRMYRNGVTINAAYKVAGVSYTASFDASTLPGGLPTGLFNFDCRWTAPGTIDLFVNGVEKDSTAIAAAIVGNLDPALCAWFAANSSGGNSWAGGGGELALSTIAQDAAFYAEKAQRSGLS